MTATGTLLLGTRLPRSGNLASREELTAVEQFAQAQQPGGFAGVERAQHYRALLPATAPTPGQQYAFEVDLDRCSGCKACVTACHSLNGLEAGESWRQVGLLVSRPDRFTPPRPELVPVPLAAWDDPIEDMARSRAPDRGLQHLTTACHHCEDPGCLNGCPVLAYEKDAVTGIVRHLDDQCIGCQYCVLKCPYDVPKYSSRLGIVRKCDLCSQRLGAGEAPACAQACPHEAIRITLVWRGETAGSGTGTSASPLPFPPGSPDSSITRPTTRFVSRRPGWDAWRAADADVLRPAPAHWPLSGMLVLTQCGVGASGGAFLTGGASARLAWWAVVVTVLGLAVGGLHLGQPLKAWRGFLGWRRSWLSRELIVFGAAVAAMMVHAVQLQPWTAGTSALLGGLAVLCSGMIYVDTKRPFWTAWLTVPKFALTTLVLGSGSVLLVAVQAGHAHWVTTSTAVMLVASLLKLAGELLFVWHSHTGRPSPWQTSARLHMHGFRVWLLTRVILGSVGGGLLPSLMLAGLVPATAWCVAFGLVLSAAGEAIERHLFFVCEAAPRLPGGIAA